MLNTAIFVAKTGAQIASGVGVKNITRLAIKNVTPKRMDKTTKVCIKAGALVLESLAGKAAYDYVGKEVDETVDDIKKVVRSIRRKLK